MCDRSLNGEIISVAEACRRLNMDATLVRNRISIGWTAEKAISTPRLWSRPDLAGKPKPKRKVRR